MAEPITGETPPVRDRGVKEDPSRSFASRRSVVVLGFVVLIVALGWLPGQARESTLRFWLVVGVLPLASLSRMTHPRRALVLAPFALLAVLAALFSLWAPFPGAALEHGLVLWGVWGGATLGMWAARSGKPDELALGVTLAGVASALSLLVRANATFGNPDYLAGFLALTAPWSVVLMTSRSFSTPRTARWIASGAALTVQLVALVVLDSLGAYLALTATGAATLGLYFARQKRRLVVVAIILISTVGLALVSSTDTVQEHLSGRAYLLRVTATVIEDSMPLGVGPGQFHRTFLDAQAEYLVDKPEDLSLWTNAGHSHNEVAQALAEWGLLGVLLLLPFVIGVAFPRQLAPWGTVIGFVTLGLFSMPLTEPATAFFASLCLGVGLAGKFSVAKSTSKRADRAWRVAFGVLAMVAMLASTSNLLGDRLLAKGSDARDPVLLSWSASLSLNRARALHHEAAALLPTDPRAAYQHAREAVSLDPSPVGWLQTGRAAMRCGAGQDAIDAFEESVRLHPRFFAGHFNLARAYEDEGDRHTARRHAIRAKSLRPTDPRLHWLPD